MKRKNDRTSKTIPLYLMIPQFIRHYGHDFFYSDRWTTRDHIIPFKHFMTCYRAMFSTFAQEKMHALQAVHLGTALANTPSDKMGPINQVLEGIEDVITGDST